MSTESRAAVLFLRMSPQLRQALRDAADRAGCSLNAFAVQILATAAGDPSRFRSVAEAPEPRELKRDHLGYPISVRERAIHLSARNQFMVATEKELGSTEMFRLSKHYDANDPGYYVEWQRARRVS